LPDRLSSGRLRLFEAAISKHWLISTERSAPHTRRPISPLTCFEPQTFP
jgi:hypothetical protein